MTFPSTRSTRATRARHGRILAALLLTLGGAGVLSVASHHLAHARVPRPAEPEMGLGPRSSASGTYQATLLPDRPLAVGPMQSVKLSLVDGSGRPVAGATLAVDGGMPAHGHGLPTRPRVSASAEAGIYMVAGLRFNMRGWWVLKFGISAAAGTDSVTFNIKL
jgi:YtkA-like